MLELRYVGILGTRYIMPCGSVPVYGADRMYALTNILVVSRSANSACVGRALGSVSITCCVLSLAEVYMRHIL
jgi:hypothetical protein